VARVTCSVKVISSRNFDGFLLTGLYTVTSASYVPADDRRIMAADSSGFVCSIVHSHIGHRPRHQLQFVWKAPSAAIGCINFLSVEQAHTILQGHIQTARLEGDGVGKSKAKSLSYGFLYSVLTGMKPGQQRFTIIGS